MKKLFLLLFIFSIAAFPALAQRPLGTWVSFPPYGLAVAVAQSEDRVYCGTPHAIYYVEKSDGSIGTLTKASGLSDADIGHLAYHPGKQTLVITYANTSNIDLLVNGTDIYNIPDIKNAVINGSKNINNVTVIGEYAYLATDLGISVLDLDKQEIKDNYILGSGGQSIKVNSIASDGIYIYAATDEGLKSAPLSAANLQDYHSWHIYGITDGLPPGASGTVGQAGSRVYTTIGDTLFSSGGAGFTRARYDTGYSYQALDNSGGALYALVWGPSNKMIKLWPDGSMTDISLTNAPRPLQLVTDGNDLWLADMWSGLVKYTNNAQIEIFSINSPPTNSIFRMAVSNANTLYVCAGGGGNANYGDYNYDHNGPIVYDHNKGWKSYNLYYYGNISRYEDLVDIAVDNVHGKIYYASLRGGVLEMDANTNDFVTYDTSNSTLKYLYADHQATKVSALCLDPSGNLWMANVNSPQYLCVKTPDGHWGSFALPSGAGLHTARQIASDDYGQIWIGGYGSQMIVYNPGQDVLSATDDQTVLLGTSSGNGGLPTANIFSITKDKNGDMWVGTDQGIGTFYCAGSVINNGNVGCDATRIKVNVGGFIGYLFSSETVKSIAVDGANRKWVGSTNGVWLISEDGTTQLLHFTADNSPLPSNLITNIAIDQKTGEVFIGTEDGLVSYQGDAILGNSNKGTALVYPNPVKHDYDGPIAIKGLVDNAYVKITDAAGILVYQGRANGGQMIWDGKGYSGTKVATGIYIVYAATDGGDQHNVGKIIFIN